MQSPTEAYHELCSYSMTRQDADFIHQHVVDAFAAQDAKPEDKPIRLAFALAGLYLHVERGFNGRQVQKAHMVMARNRKSWPRFEIPDTRGDIDARHILSAEKQRWPELIHSWAESVWRAYADQRDRVKNLLDQYEIH